MLASLEITKTCHRGCAYCASGSADKKELSFAAWCEIIETLAKSGTVAVSLTGGEPLEREDVVEIAAHAKAFGLFVGLNTNGFLLNSRQGILRFLDRVTLSVDGPQAVNDMVRGEGAFQAAMQAIALARAKCVPVTVMAVVSRASIPSLEPFLQMLSAMGLAAYFQPAYEKKLRSDAIENPIRPDQHEIASAFATLIELKNKGLPVLNSTAALRLIAGLESPSRFKCFGGSLFVRITSDGHLAICGLPSDPVKSKILFFDGLEQGLKAVASLKKYCTRCESAVRAEINLLASLNFSAWVERLKAFYGG